MGDYIKDKEGCEWVYYVYLLQKGDIEKVAKQEEKLREKKINKEREIQIVKEFYLNKNFPLVCKIAQDYLKKRDQKFGIEESLAFLYSSIILKEKEFAKLLLDRKIIKMGFPYLMGYFFLNENLPQDEFINFEYPDELPK